MQIERKKLHNIFTRINERRNYNVFFYRERTKEKGKEESMK